ncbi:LysM peptidoglycan-binding domain-containing protein [Phytoactinopolyspora halotolerans]|uniref:LysM peptidoglycan-binding domain-containing protein n=2 Tax=Phytoactinopolyspora halotolerans TaxID=1981512 RepID=A0A6L9SBM0_9ACTN|nr:LysM peptidoglycan-binding domain-containing protein [Phytoactinopolyspora halotolerans]
MAPLAARHLVRATLGMAVATVPLTGAAAYGAGPHPAPAVSAAAAAGSLTVDVDSLPEIGRPPVAEPELGDRQAMDPSPEDHRTDGRPPEAEPPDAEHPPAHEGPNRDGAARNEADRDEAQTTGTVTVKPGDTLWSLAAEHLGPGATSADVAAEWPRWYEANRSVIGPDPDIIQPGTRLNVPMRP